MILPSPSLARIDKKKASSLFFVAKWVAFSLFGVFTFTVIGRVFPFAVLQPAWQLALALAIISYAYMPLLAISLVLLADRLEDRSSIKASTNIKDSNLLKQLRNFAIPAALGFLLLIPLQAYNAVKIARQNYAQAQQELIKVQKALGSIQQAQTEMQLRTALQSFPGLPEQ